MKEDLIQAIRDMMDRVQSKKWYDVVLYFPSLFQKLEYARTKIKEEDYTELRTSLVNMEKKARFQTDEITPEEIAKVRKILETL
jgi:ribosomal protein S3AE